MDAAYISRSLEPVLIKAAAEFPVVVVTGPRQSGKTTLLQRLFAGKCRYVSLDLPDIWTFAQEDPRGFLDQHSPPVILDEVQHAPQLLPYIRAAVDAKRHLPGQYLLTGSHTLALSERVTESLAGRAAMLRLFPLSRRERLGQPRRLFPWEGSKDPLSGGNGIWEEFIRGSYPEVVANPARDARLWHGSYIQTYLERDVRSLRQIGDLGQFQSFLRMLAANSGQLLNLSSLSRNLGVVVNTLKAWISILEATFQVTVLRPYHANVGKRLVKLPKVYFNDVGTLCYLAGLSDPAHAASGPLGGVILETAVLSELQRTLVHRGETPEIYFWRTSAGTEVDFVFKQHGQLIPLEVKVTGTPNRAMARSARSFVRDLAERQGYLVHTGTVDHPLGGWYPGASVR